MLKLLSFIFSLSLLLNANVLTLQPEMEGVSTLSSLSFFEDKSKQLTIEEIKNQKFQTDSSFRSSHGVSKSNWWLKYEVLNPSNKNIDWVLRFNHSQFDELQSWQYDANNNLVSHFLKGDHNLNESESSLNGHSSFAFTTAAKEKETIYVKIAYVDAGVMELFHSIWSKDAFVKSQETRFNVLVGILSAIGILLFYNIFLWLFLRKKEYFWYNAYLIGVISTIMTFNQLGAHYIWTNSMYFMDMMPFFAIVTVLVSFIMFTREFLETSKQLPRVDQILKIIIMINILAIILANLGLRHYSVAIVHLTSFTVVLFPIIGFVLWRRGYKIARGYIIASTILAIAVLSPLLRFSEVLHTSELLLWTLRFGFIAEGVLLAIALADRITILETTKITAQEEVKHVLEKAKQTLEFEVEKRTQELEVQTQKAEKLARTDVMTGISNRRAFLERGKEMVYEAIRYKTPFSLIIIDIDHFKKVNDTYGHESGDLVLQSFATEIGKHIRDNDFFARIGGEEFVLLLPHTSSDEALQKAHALVDAIKKLEISYKTSSINITASMGVCQFLHEDDTIDTLLSKADLALYHVKEHGRNNAFVY